ncbi:MAG: tetratricopeptide repeat protein [Desulfobacteraceae bacterium]|nr:MAG: tetratricopeptide repeat protein [Desulfobacteraceae bacterium]
MKQEPKHDYIYFLYNFNAKNKISRIGFLKDCQDINAIMNKLINPPVSPNHFPMALVFQIHDSEHYFKELYRTLEPYLLDPQKCYLFVGLETAMEAIEKTCGLEMHLYPYNALAYFNIGKYYDDRDQFEKAVKYYDQAAQVDPHGSEGSMARWMCASAYSSQGKRKRALAEYTLGIRAHSHDPARFYHGRAELYLELKQYDKAFIDFKNAIRFADNRDLEKYHFDFSQAYYVCRKYKKALAEINRSLHLFYKNRRHAASYLDEETDRLENDFWLSIILIKRGKILLRLNELERAAADFKKSIELAEDSEACHYLGNIYRSMGDHQAAQAHWQTAARIGDKKCAKKLAKFYPIAFDTFQKRYRDTMTPFTIRIGFWEIEGECYC